jgi:Domain of unknown function (DUF4282)
MPENTSVSQSGFFGALFDLSFTSLITTKIIRVLYMLSMIVIGVVALIVVVAGFLHSGGTGIVLLVLAPIFSLIFLVYVRVLLEISIALLRIMENTTDLVAQGRSSSVTP